MSEKVINLENAYGGKRLDTLLGEIKFGTSERVSRLLNTSDWPEWLQDPNIERLARDYYALQATVLGFKKEEISAFQKLNLLSLVKVCREDEGANPNDTTTLGSSANSYLSEENLPDKSLQKYIASLFDSKFTYISLYPQRMDSKDAFLASLCHEITHQLVNIRVAQIALKKGMDYKTFMGHKFTRGSNGKRVPRANTIIVHEALAHLEGGQRIINLNPTESRRQAGEGITENSAYDIGTNIGFTIYTSQVGIYNHLGGAGISYDDKKLFYAWCQWIREEMLDCFFDAERIIVIGKLLNKFEGKPGLFIKVFRENIQPHWIPG